MQNAKCEKSRNPSISPCCTHFSLFSAKTYYISVTHIFCICENCIRNYSHDCRINENGGGILTESHVFLTERHVFLTERQKNPQIPRPKI